MEKSEGCATRNRIIFRLSCTGRPKKLMRLKSTKWIIKDSSTCGTSLLDLCESMDHSLACMGASVSTLTWLSD